MLLAMTININEKKTTGRRKSVIQHEVQGSVRQRLVERVTGAEKTRGRREGDDCKHSGRMNVVAELEPLMTPGSPRA